MRKGFTEIVFILDRSGSMTGLEKDTIGGFNSLIEKQKKEDGQCVVSTVLFDYESDVIHDRVDIKKVNPLTDREYYVSTAMSGVYPKASESFTKPSSALTIS